MAEWIDLIDPSLEELRAKLPRAVQESALALLVAPARHTDEPRPTLQAHGDYIFGVFLLAIAVPEEDRVFYQEIDVVVTHDVLLSVSKTPPNEHPYDPRPVRESCKPDDEGGMMLYRLIDDIAEHYLDLIDALDGEIDELEDTVETAPAESTRNRLSELRHDLLHIRRTLSPTRDAVRRVVDNVIEVDEGKEVFPHDVEIAFNSAYDKLLRAFDGLELSRDLIASVRDYLQAKVANDQNEVMKTLTVIASLLLLPTFIVGLYGQNFQHHFPEIHWQLGYLWSWALIVVTTIGQLVFFRRKKWI
ncbi:MAG: magnesium transporter CorA family protein [Actinobacteria bacterium]|nr:MAG: magnesium transporter CorA family protein [Actinomycetota bacterium]